MAVWVQRLPRAGDKTLYEIDADDQSVAEAAYKELSRPPAAWAPAAASASAAPALELRGGLADRAMAIRAPGKRVATTITGRAAPSQRDV